MVDYYILFLLMTLIFWKHCFKYLNNKVIEEIIELRGSGLITQ